MVSFGSTPFVSVAKLEMALQLDGEKASRPLKAGQTIAAHGMFDGAPDTVALNFSNSYTWAKIEYG